MQSDWIAFIADLQASRRLANPEQFAKHLSPALEELEKRYRAEWRAPLMITAGLDRLSGLLKQPRHAFDVAVDLNLQAWPERYRVAVAAGPLHVGMNTRSAAAMHGPAFHRASEALERARTSDLLFAIDLGAQLEVECELAENVARLHATIMESWTEARARAVKFFRELGNQQEVAARLGISQQAVSQALAGAHHEKLQDAERAMQAWLGKVSTQEKSQ